MSTSIYKPTKSKLKLSDNIYIIVELIITFYYLHAWYGCFFYIGIVWSERISWNLRQNARIGSLPSPGLSCMAVLTYINTFQSLNKHMQLVIYTFPWFLFIIIDKKGKILIPRCGAYSTAALISIFDHLEAALIQEVALNRIITITKNDRWKMLF